MRKLVFGASAVALLGLLAVPSFAGDKEECTCSTFEREVLGWCKHCGAGTAFGHPIKSKKLFKVLVGHEVDQDKVSCGGCKVALKESGKCCGKTFLNNKSYGSQVGATLAKGKLVSGEKISCSACKTKWKSGGECTGCNVGYVSHMKFKKDDYTLASNAETILKKAIKAAEDCEKCAVAIVTDGTCEACKVSFKDGTKQG